MISFGQVFLCKWFPCCAILWIAPTPKIEYCKAGIRRTYVGLDFFPPPIHQSILICPIIVTRYKQGIVEVKAHLSQFHFSSVAQSCLTLCDPMNRSTPGLPVHHQLPEFTQTHVHRACDGIQPSHPLSSPSPPSLNLSQHQGLFKWVSSSHQVAKVLEFQLQHQSFQWTPRTDLL